LKALRILLGDQLSHSISSLSDIDRKNDVVLMVEAHVEATRVPCHPKKIGFVFSAMRNFSEELVKLGFTVRYFKYRDPDNRGSIPKQVEFLLTEMPFERVVVTEPGEWRLLNALRRRLTPKNIPLVVKEDDRFLCSHAEFETWAEGRKQLRMEHFYRYMRRQMNVLIEDGQPVGGKWNFDQQNRLSLPQDVCAPAPTTFQPDETTREVLELVELEFGHHFGELHPFNLGVTRPEALQVLNEFVEFRLAEFGGYQDAMRQGDPWLFHSHISLYMNIGLLDPREVVEAALQAYQEEAPLNSVEGFVRQIIGWREFVRGVYWLGMPEYEHVNFFNAKRPLPAALWGEHIDLNCVKQCVDDTRKNAYSHHIQRLMVLGNFLLLTGVDPKDVNEWYLSVYADAYEWVEMPNVNGMAIFSDGGQIASKPYAASGAYINRMSDYCGSCRYSVTEKHGPKACPFNYLYWNFFLTHKNKLKGNQRLSMVYRNIERMDSKKRQTIQADSDAFLSALT
jgi:deoxyribodipyrimidine photolyase-related protein